MPSVTPTSRDTELTLDVLKASVTIKLVAHPAVLAKFKIALDQLLSQTFAHGLYNVQTKVDKLEL